MTKFIQFILILTATCTIATACQVPVFRYALERWESDKYQLYLVTPKALDQEQTKLVSTFNNELEHTNLELNILDTSRLTDDQLWKLPTIDTSVKEAQLALYYPRSSAFKEPILTLPLTGGNLSKLIKSPARRDIINHIINGSSCVWLVLHAGQAEQAKQVQTRLDGYLKKIEKTISIPDGIIGTEERHKITDNTDLEDVLRSEIPLKISFSTQIIDRQSSAEKTFIATLLKSSPDTLTQNGEILIIPVFGRGRQLPPMPASRLEYAPILNGCQYLCGACSCQVKDQNPGSDLLIHENWPSHLTAGLAVVDKALPPLEGIGEIAKNDKNEPKNSASENLPGPRESTEPSNVFSSIPIIIGCLIVILGIITFVTVKKK